MEQPETSVVNTSEILTPPSREPTGNGDAIDLVQSATAINKMSLEIQTNEILARTHGKICLNLAIKTGGLLLDCKNEVNSKSRGKWEKWVDDNLDVSSKTAGRYIQLFEYQQTHVSALDECESIREAYLLSGIIPLPKKKEPPTGQSTERPVKSEEDSGDKIEEPPFDKVVRLEQELRTVFVDNPNLDYYGEMIKLLIPLVTIYNDYHDEQSTTNLQSVVNN